MRHRLSRKSSETEVESSLTLGVCLYVECVYMWSVFRCGVCLQVVSYIVTCLQVAASEEGGL